MVERAAQLEMPALAITDTGGIYGAVRFMQAARKFGVRPIVGSELEVGGEPIRILARTKRGYSQMTRLLSHAHKDQPKGEARTDLATVARHNQDLFFLTDTDSERHLEELQDALGRDCVFVELANHLRPEDRWVMAGRAELAGRHKAPLLASNQVRYHEPRRRPLHDVLVAIKHKASLDEVRGRLHPNAERYLKSGRQLKPLFRDFPQALQLPAELAQECEFDLDFRGVRFPGFPVPAGETPFSYLYRLTQEGARQRYHPITPAVARRLQRELDVIEKTGLAEFFLINWDLMRFARENGVPARAAARRPTRSWPTCWASPASTPSSTTCSSSASCTRR